MKHCWCQLTLKASSVAATNTETSLHHCIVGLNCPTSWNTQQQSPVQLRSTDRHSLNLRWHFLFHMVQSGRGRGSLLAGVGRAMLEKGLELMETCGISFFSEGSWLSWTMPNTSRRLSLGNILPRSLQTRQDTTQLWSLGLSSKYSRAATANWLLLTNYIT